MAAGIIALLILAAIFAVAAFFFGLDIGAQRGKEEAEKEFRDTVIRKYDEIVELKAAAEIATARIAELKNKLRGVQELVQT